MTDVAISIFALIAGGFTLELFGVYRGNAVPHADAVLALASNGPELLVENPS